MKTERQTATPQPCLAVKSAPKTARLVPSRSGASTPIINASSKTLLPTNLPCKTQDKPPKSVGLMLKEMEQRVTALTAKFENVMSEVTEQKKAGPK